MFKKIKNYIIRLGISALKRSVNEGIDEAMDIVLDKYVEVKNLNAHDEHTIEAYHAYLKRHLEDELNDRLEYFDKGGP